MTASRMIQKEFMRNLFVSLLVLVGASLSIMSIKALTMVTSGSLDPRDVFLYTMLLALRQLPVVLCISLLIAIVSALSRLANDSEIVILNTTGWGPYDTLKTVIKFSTPVISTIFILSIFIWPLGSKALKDIRESFESKAQHEKAKPGVFTANKSKDQIIFVGNDSDKSIHDIFIFKKEANGYSFTKSDSGSLESRTDETWAHLDSGSTIRIQEDKNTISATDFKSNHTKLKSKTSESSSEEEPNNKSTYQLITEPSPKNLSELSWRIGLVLSALNLSIAAILFPATNQRMGKSGNFIFALLTFTLYMNLIILGQRYIQTQRAGFLEYNLALHGTFFIALIFAVQRKQSKLS